MADEPQVDPATTAVDEDDARSTHGADRGPTPEEARKAEEHDVDPEVAEAYEAANERGANVEGEGKID